MSNQCGLPAGIAGVDILAAQRFMGHSDPTVTMSIYSHLAKEKEDVSTEHVRNAISEKVAKRLPESKTVNQTNKIKSPKP